MTPPPDKIFYRARVTWREDIAPDLWKVRIDPGGEFRFAPGQYATLGVETAEKLVERPYSIASAPHEPELEFFVELVTTGALTPHLYKLQVGDELAMRKVAKGRFTLDTKSGRKNHLLICTVTGMAPFVSYFRALLKDAREGRFAGEHKLYCLEGASRSWEFGYQKEAEQAAAEAPWFTYIPTVSRPWEDTAWNGEIGRVDELVRKYCDQWGLKGSDTTAYLCGNGDMIEHVKGILTRDRFPKENVKEEVYW